VLSRMATCSGSATPTASQTKRVGCCKSAERLSHDGKKRGTCSPSTDADLTAVPVPLSSAAKTSRTLVRNVSVVREQLPAPGLVLLPFPRSCIHGVSSSVVPRRSLGRCTRPVRRRPGTRASRAMGRLPVLDAHVEASGFAVTSRNPTNLSFSYGAYTCPIS
jgi:hypothetical protein